jgi:hypothetical protein
VQNVVARGEELLQHPTILLPARQLAAALLAVGPAFSVDKYSSMKYDELRKLQGRFLLPRKEERTAAVQSQIRQNNVFNTIYQSGKSVEARAWLDAIPKSEAQTLSPMEFRTAFRNRLLIPHPQLLAHTTCTCGKDVDCYGVHTQKCRQDGYLLDQRGYFQQRRSIEQPANGPSRF